MSDIGNLYYVEGDTGPDLLCTFTEYNLSGYTITLHVRKSDGTSFSITATPVDLPNGQFKFVWSAGQLTRGNHTMEIEFIDSGGKRFTVPAQDKLGLVVRKDIEDA